LTFIYDEGRGRALAISADEVLIQLQQQLTLVLAGCRQAEVGKDVLQELARRKPRVKYVAKRDVVLGEPSKKALHQQRLASSDFPRDHHKSLSPLDSVQQIGQGFVVKRRGAIKARIRTDFERVAL